MTTNKHTPGPWEVEPRRISNEDDIGKSVVSDTLSRALQKWHDENPDVNSGFVNCCTTVAEISPSYNGSGKQVGPWELISADEIEANARLIAAAPEMLEALVHCHDWILATQDENKQGETERLEARAAIAKAKGEQT